MELTLVRSELQLWRRREMKACMRDDGADACEEGDTVVETGAD